MANFCNKRVLVLYVGGTIGMEKNENNVYTPKPNKLLAKLKSSSRMHQTYLAAKYSENLTDKQLVFPAVGGDIVLYELQECKPLLDSCNMTSEHWIKIAKDIEKNYIDFDGFVVLHGTDTLTYTASALSFMLEGLQKPVILTGSQIPIFEMPSDAEDNILSSLIFAGCYDIPEVCIFFANKLLRGNRTVKISSVNFSAFDSFNYAHLAGKDVNTVWKVNNHLIMKPSEIPFKVHTELNSNVGLLKIFPTIEPTMIKGMLQRSSLQGLVLESYGAGNIPSNHKEIVEIIKKAVNSGILIVNVTQCIHGNVSTSYEAGAILKNVGVISGHDMTTEAALTKLCYVLGISGLSYNDRVEQMEKNIRGELTNNHTKN